MAASSSHSSPASVSGEPAPDDGRRRQADDHRFRAIFDSTYQFIGLLQPDGTVVEINQTALDFGGLTRDDVIGKPFWACHWWTISRDTQEQLQAAIERAAQGEMVRYEVDVLDADGQPTPIDFSIKPVRNDAGRVVMLIPEGHDVSALQQAHAERLAYAHDMATFSERLKQLHRLSTTHYDRFEDLLEDYLRTGCRIFDMQVGVVNHVEGEHCTFEASFPQMPGYEQGAEYDLSEMYCEAVVDTEQTIAYPDVALVEALQDHPAYVNLHVRAYLGTPIHVNGRLYGVLLFVSEQPRDAFDTHDREVIELMAESIGRSIELDRVEREREETLAELVQEREFLKAVLDNIEEGIVACDAGGTLTLFNRATRAFHGLPPQPLSPDAWAEHYDLYRPDGTPLPRDEVPLYRAFQGERLRGVEIRIIPEKGKDRTLVVNGQPLVAADGTKIGAVVAMHDVTERLEAERRLRENQRQLSRAQRIAHLGNWHWDVEADELTWSDELYRIYGLEPGADLSFERFVGLLHPDDRDDVLATINEAMQTHAPFAFYHRIVRPDDEVRVLRGEGEVFVDEDGTVLRMFGTGHDVTEVRQAEAALWASDERFRLLVESIQDYAIFMLDPEGCVVSWNKGAERIQEYAEEEILGEHFSIFYPDEEKEAGTPAQVLAQAAAQGRVEQEGWRLRKDGTRFWAYVVLTAIQDKEGRLRGYAKVTRDLTELREVGERMRLLEAAVSASLDGITIADVSQPDDPLVYVSPGFERMTGYPAEEVLGRNCRFLQRDDRDQPALDGIRAALRDGRQCRVTLRNYRKDGSLFWNELTLYPLHDADGALTHYVGIQRDVTERKQAEQELARMNTKLEQRNRELQDFAYVASHDLQEPLRKIRAFADLMREDYEEQVDEMGQYYLDRMQDAATRMSQLITDLLAYSRITTRARPFDRVDLNAVVAEVLSDLEVQISEAEGSIGVGDLPTIKADPTQMRQLVQNFIANALKFSRPGVRPVVEVHGTVETSDVLGTEQEVCRLEVSDNGIGFDEKYLERIFTPFQRLHGRGTYAGTGMGLAICRRIVERHQGLITARSVPDEGTTFIVTLPVHQNVTEQEDDAS